MRYKRQESFRFSFGSPLAACFTINETNGKAVTSQEGPAALIDLSPNGLRLSTTLNIPDSSPPAKVTIRFTLNNTEFNVQGEIVWKKNRLNQFYYGVSYLLEDKDRERLIDELKIFAKKNR